jgi:CheY-like chemotaxis protein
VCGDAVRLKQVLTNLVSNAVKFTPAGLVQMRVAWMGAGRYRFSVRDTGVGFDPAIKDRIFARFQQADGSITRRFGGTGLGLAISRQLVDLMGGELDCHSVPGEGSEFWLTLDLPAAAADALKETLAHSTNDVNAPEILEQPASASDEVGDERPLRILIADDHATNRTVIQMILAQAGADLTLVEDGAQAVEAFRGTSFDLVLMDMQMPVLDGLSATAEIRRFEGVDGRARTPVIMLTANALPEHVASALEAGADRHHAKPVTAEPLFAAIAEVLAAAELREAA